MRCQLVVNAGLPQILLKKTQKNVDFIQHLRQTVRLQQIAFFSDLRAVCPPKNSCRISSKKRSRHDFFQLDLMCRCRFEQTSNNFNLSIALQLEGENCQLPCITSADYGSNHLLSIVCFRVISFAFFSTHCLERALIMEWIFQLKLGV